MLNELAVEINKNSVEHGWWAGRPARSFGDIIALIHSEASEALEEYRAGHGFLEIYWKFPNGEIRSVPEDEERNPGNPEGIPIEFADIIIRVLDACAALGIDIDKAMAVKMAYNQTRPMLHGGKRI
jgi:hypothetical protein